MLPEVNKVVIAPGMQLAAAAPCSYTVYIAAADDRQAAKRPELAEY